MATLAGALAVVAAFTAGGFVWWDAYPVLVRRYWAGVAHLRPAGYWVWGDLAAFAIATGPVLGPAVAATIGVARHRVGGASRAVALLAGAAVLTILIADATQLSKAEVERIWLPFVPWALTGAALLPATWRRGLLALGVVSGLAVQHLLYTAW